MAKTNENFTPYMEELLSQISDLCYQASEEVYEDEEMEELEILTTCDILYDKIDKYLKRNEYAE